MNKEFDFINELDTLKAIKSDPRTSWIIIGGSHLVGITDEYSDYDVFVFGDYEHDDHFPIVIDSKLKIHAAYKDVNLFTETNPWAWPIFDSSMCIAMSLNEDPIVLYIKEGKEDLFENWLTSFKSKSELASRWLLFYYRDTVKRYSKLTFDSRKCKKYYHILLASSALLKEPLDCNLLKNVKRMNIKRLELEHEIEMRHVFNKVLDSYDIFTNPAEPLDQIWHTKFMWNQWYKTNNKGD